MENYAQVQKIYTSEQFKKTQADSLKQAVAQFEGGAAAPAADGTTTPPTAQADKTPDADGFTRGTLTTDQVATVLKDVAYEGKADAKIALVEYSDIECPFCQRHFSSKTVETVLAKYADSVKATFKHFPLSFHPTAQKAAEGVECAAKQGKAVEFKNALFEAAIADAGKKPTKEVILATAKKLALKEADFSKCLDSGETADKIKSDMNEGGSLFGVTGTPGNVLINTETGKYVVIAGAYPADQFDAVVAELSK
jgi:protein-disulfide isomerase